MSVVAASSDRFQLGLPPISLLHLQIAVRWRRPPEFPTQILPNVLRGALSLTLRRLVCPPDWLDQNCHPCSLYAQCPYGQVFQPTPPADAAQLSRQADLPRPFILKPPRREEPPADPSDLKFGLVLFGRAIDFLPHFVVTLSSLGAEGMGPRRIPFDLQSITSRHRGGDESLYDPATHHMRRPVRLITNAELAYPLRIPQPALRIHFRTPTLLKTGSRLDASGRRVPAREVRRRPEFGVLLRRLRDRLSALCAFFGQPWTTANFAELGHLADQVRLVHDGTRWQHQTRRSTRTGQSHELSGLVGYCVYQFPDGVPADLILPLLHLASYIHIGKHAAWGNGWVEVEEVE